MRNLAISIVVLLVTLLGAQTASANCLTELFSTNITAEQCRQQLRQQAAAEEAERVAYARAADYHYYRVNPVTCGDQSTGPFCGDRYGRPVGREGYWWGGGYYDYYADGYRGGRWYRQRYKYLYRYSEGDTDMMVPPDPPVNVRVREGRVWRCTGYELHWMCEVEKAKKTDVFVRNSPRGFPIYENPPG